MKRVIAAVVLLCVVVGGCICALLWERATLERLKDLAHTAEQRFSEGDMTGAERAAQELESAFDRDSQRLALFVPHTALAEAESNIDSLSSVLRYGEEHEFVTEVRRCVAVLERLWEQERPSLSNIL